MMHKNQTTNFEMPNKSRCETTNKVKRRTSQNILHSLSLLNVQYSPLKKNNGCEEDLAREEYFEMDWVHKANAKLPRHNYVKNGCALEKV